MFEILFYFAFVVLDFNVSLSERLRCDAGAILQLVSVSVVLFSFEIDFDDYIAFSSRFHRLLFLGKYSREIISISRSRYIDPQASFEII